MKRNMKNWVLLICAIAIIVVTIFADNYLDSRSHRKGYVEKVENGIVYIIDTSGERWSWEGEEGQSFDKWDNVKMTFNTKGTDDFKDDEMIKIRLDK